jgi:hypothetical protein
MQDSVIDQYKYHTRRSGQASLLPEQTYIAFCLDYSREQAVGRFRDKLQRWCRGRILPKFEYQAEGTKFGDAKFNKENHNTINRQLSGIISNVAGIFYYFP